MGESTPRNDGPADKPSPRDEAQIRALLEEILETNKLPREVSGGDIVLERILEERLHRLRGVHAEMEAMFPTPVAGTSPTRRLLRDSFQSNDRLPEIPGYEVLDVIGTGGMGVVYRARHLKLNRLVAIKMVLLGAYASREDLECLLREAQNVAALRHPNIVQVYDVAEHDGFPYYSMELLEKGDLAQMLQGKPRPAKDAADLVRVLADAIHAAHLAGIVHRDLKPGNILLNEDQTTKIGDFSLSRRVELDSTRSTKVPRAGTPSYMAPEQAAGERNAIQPTVDIYSLGAVLYELLTGRPPFKAETSAETLQQVIHDDPVSPSQLNSRVPCDLQTICLKCLQKDPTRRYLSAADLADDLNRFLSGEPIHARPISFAERTFKWCRRRPAISVAMVVSVIALTGAITGGFWIQQLEHARHTEEIVRREGARKYITSSLPLLSQLVRSRQWSDAKGVLRTARTRLEDAQSSDLEIRLTAAAEEFEIAEELERIRQSFPEPNDAGYNYLPARDAYAKVFHRFGIGSDVEVKTAALRISESSLREELLMALDYAAFTENFNADDSELRRLLSMGRTAAPSHWQDRFRDPATWKDLPSLQRLVNDASTAQPPPLSHQMVMVGFLLSSLNHNHTAIEILREAHLRDPSDFWVNLELGHVLSHQNKNAEAIQYFRAAVALKPTHFVAWTWLGRAQLSNANSEAAIVSLRRAISLRPEYPTSWQILISALAASERWDEALAAQRDALAANSPIMKHEGTAAVLRLCRGRSAAAKQQWPLAVESYADAIAGGYAINTEVWFEYAAVRILADDATGHREVCTAMLDRCEKDNLRRFLVARACTLVRGTDQELARAAEEGMPELDLHAETFWSLTQRGALLCRQKKHREAIAVLEQSLRANSRPEDCIITWVWLSRANLSLEEEDAARMWLGQVNNLLDQSTTKPDGIHLHNWLEALTLRRELVATLADSAPVIKIN
ncbi:Serine/threonine-protein kinase PknB [Bremerella volcania]|uniref:Serine/threonine-protein kinase PknB n=1 Tax=Bremerella volcania TaxID=2527984 RepID=A0A518C9L1_9BACT|nr:serine/threonine-protein kinase [Bremerella volcania]QDU75900.1 Serine/threonine-protein kinase PknB [Bremerella volcania]